MANTHNDAASRDSTTADAGIKDKNLQLKATAEYQKAVLAVANAQGYKTISDFLQFLLNREISAALEQLDDLDDEIEKRKALEAAEEKANLRKALGGGIPVAPPVVGKKKSG